MKNTLIYKIIFTSRENAVSLNKLSNSKRNEYYKERDNLPEYVLAEDLVEAIKRVEKQKLQFFLPREFTVHAQGIVI